MESGHVSRKRRPSLALLLLAAFLLSACATQGRPWSGEELRQKYLAAVKDAETAEPDEISRDLTAIVDHDRKLIRDDRLPHGRVLVVTWTSDFYDKEVGLATVLSRDVWVTVAPELKDFCAKERRTRGDPTLRLKQLLGLPPHSEKTRFVEVWVDPSDLFRPSPDPEITDHEAGLDFPASERFVTVNPEHVRWLVEQKNTSYGENGYPWTRLGYTYDWGNPKSEMGLSEFVIRKGATVEIRSSSSMDDYCR